MSVHVDIAKTVTKLNAVKIRSYTKQYGTFWTFNSDRSRSKACCFAPLKDLKSKVYHTLWYMLVFYLISSCKGMKISFFKSVFIFCFFTEIAPKCGDVFDIYSSFFYHRVLWHWHGLQRMKRLLYICMYIYIHLYCYNVEEMLLFHKYSCFFW